MTKQKINNKNSISIIISIGIIVLSILYIILTNTSDNINQFQAQRGIMDLSNWDSNKNIYLEGEWESYLNKNGSADDSVDEEENTPDLEDIFTLELL